MPILPPDDAPYYDEIRLYAVRLTHNWSIGEDIAQDVYLRFFQNKTSIPETAQRAWLYRTARNLVIDLFRRQKRTAKVEEILKTDVLPSRQENSTADPQQVLERQETENRLIERLNQLPPRHREVVRLKFQQQLSYDEIATVTGETKPMVGWLLHEAIQKLKKEYSV